jgi:hypothetical protein
MCMQKGISYLDVDRIIGMLRIHIFISNYYKMTEDVINHPKHYTFSKFEVIDVIEGIA